MNDKDREVLEALTDYSHLSRFIKKVEAYARKKAFALDVSQDAALYAVDRVTDWLMKGDKVNHPAAYVNAIIHNALIDYRRMNRPTYDVTQRDLVNIVGVGNRLYADENEDRPTGWYAIEVDKKHPKDIEKPPKDIKKDSPVTIAEFAELLERILPASEPLESYDPEKVVQHFYKQLAKQLNGISGAEEKRVLEYYLRGYRQREIVVQLDKKKEYVSRTINKWLKIWGWGKMDVEENRHIFLTRQLADLYLKLSGEGDLQQKLYHAVISSFETKAYFYALPESESEELIRLCEEWVENYRPKITPDWYEQANEIIFEKQESESRQWEIEKKARVKFFCRIPKERRRDYVRTWREEAEYFRNNRLLNLVAELEKKLTF